MRLPIALAAATGSLLLTGGTVAHAGTALLYERALLAEADRRCDLFEPAVTAALQASVAQARGAALHSGSAVAAQAAEGRALLRARQTPCGSPELQTAAARVRSAFAGWSRLRRMTFPGPRAEWRADRTLDSEPRWRLSQAARLDDQPAVFGLAAMGPGSPRLTAVARLRERPAFVRLRLPDGRVFLAGRREGAPKPLRPKGWGEALAYRFPAAATGAVAALDRNAVVKLEFVSPTRTGERTRSAVIEVGDFAAAQAFLAVGGA